MLSEAFATAINIGEVYEVFASECAKSGVPTLSYEELSPEYKDAFYSCIRFVVSSIGEQIREAQRQEKI